MNNNNGALSIDFLIGFTIFILAFIWVATMIPNLFLGLASHTIDYDAVAYRTGVILAEDPGAVNTVYVTDGSPWEVQSLITGKDNVARFGLAISKDSPNILSEEKVKRFFNSTAIYPQGWVYPDDYQKRAIFGDYPYRFNISLNVTGTGEFLSVGDIVPEHHSYGYIRRDVKVKQAASNTTINATPPKTHWDSVFNEYSVMIDSNELLYGKVRDPAYQIIPQTDRITINITNLTGSMNQTAPSATYINLSKIVFYKRDYGTANLDPLPAADVQNYTIYVDGGSTPSVFPGGTPANPGIELKHSIVELSNISLLFEPGAFSQALEDEHRTVFINLTFGIKPGEEYLNSSTPANPLFNYTYTQKNPQKGFVSPPTLQDGVLEVAVW